MEHNEAELLRKKYLEGRCTPEEAKMVEDTYDKQLLRHSVPSSAEKLDIVRERTWSNIAARTSPKMFALKNLVAAAVLLIALGFSYYLLNEKQSTDTSGALQVADVPPGSNRATISLSTGERLDLDSTQSSLFSQDGRFQYEDGREFFDASEAAFATVQTPRAGQYLVILPDSSKVWLNSDSYITYPVRFSAYERRLEIHGEAFLEVSKDPQRPFIVESDEQEIQVLGTSFNIDTYGDQGKSVTTLVEGKLRVVDHRSETKVFLAPGQQAVLTKGKPILVEQVDTRFFTSWKDGVFVLKNESLAKFAKQLERWYDVQIDLGGQESTALSAIIHREAKLSEVLGAIEGKTGITFKIEGRRVIATEK